MQSKSILRYVEFGKVICSIKGLKPGDAAHSPEGIITLADSLASYLREFEMPVTERAAAQLLEVVDKLRSSDSAHTLSEAECGEIVESLEKLESTLVAEAGGRVAYIVSDKRIDVNKLLSRVPSLMSPEVFGAIPGSAKYDLMEAGKCIAFERPTAAALHILRATESVVRTYYIATARKTRVRNLTFKRMLDSIRKRRNSLPEELINEVEIIHSTFQNPAAHLDKIYDIQEVQDLFGQCLGVINRIVPHIPVEQETPKAA